MADSDAVSAFRTFARSELLNLLARSDEGRLAKEPTYQRIREAFQSQGRWATELDEAEAGPAQTPRWLNRLHWAVADLVQEGLLEQSSGSNELRLTGLGRDLVHLPAPFADTPAIRDLIRALDQAQPDLAWNSKIEDLLRQFRERFPPERLSELDLESYALGTGNPQSFCWWLERGLEENGKYSVGSSRSHLIYRAQDGSWYRVQRLQALTPEDAMRQVAAWHARVAALGASDDPEQLDREPGEFVAPARVLKLLNSYFPDRFLPINSPDHLAIFLERFGVPKEAVPDGAVGRNRLLFRLYEAIGGRHQLGPADFAHLLYTHFEPRGVKLDAQRVRGAIRLFGWLYGEPSCRAPRFLTEERNYKVRAVERWQEMATPEELERALEEGNELPAVASLRQILTGQDREAPHNLLSYRYWDVLRADDRSAARELLEALLELLRSGEAEEAVPDVGRFNQRLATSLRADRRGRPGCRLAVHPNPGADAEFPRAGHSSPLGPVQPRAADASRPSRLRGGQRAHDDERIPSPAHLRRGRGRSHRPARAGRHARCPELPLGRVQHAAAMVWWRHVSRP